MICSGITSSFSSASTAFTASSSWSYATSEILAPGKTSLTSALKAAVSPCVSLESVLMRSARMSTCSSSSGVVGTPLPSLRFSSAISWPPPRRIVLSARNPQS